MSERRDVERLLRSHLADAANPSPRRGQLLEVMAKVERQNQRPRLYASVAADGRLALDEGQRRRTAAVGILVAAALLIALGIAGLLAGGPRDLAVVPTPRPSLPAVEDLHSPVPTDHPTPTPAFTGAPACDPAITTTSLADAVGPTPPTPASVSAGKLAVFAGNPDGPSDIVLVDPATGDQSTLVSLGVTAGKYRHLAWAPDGSALAIGISGDCGSGIYTWADGKLSHLLPEGLPGIGFNEEEMAWSPDASQLLLWVVDKEGPGEPMWILSRNGGTPLQFQPTCPLCSEIGLTWSPDMHVLGGAHENLTDQQLAEAEIGIVFLDPATGTWTTIHEPNPAFGPIGWRNNHVLLVVNRKEQLVAYDATDGSRHVLPVDGTGADQVVPGGRQVVTASVVGSGASMHSVIGLLDLATGDRRTLYTSPKGTTYGGGIIAPDGSAVAYSGGNDATQETSAVIIQLDGSGVKVLPGIDLSRAAWQPVPQP